MNAEMYKATFGIAGKPEKLENRQITQIGGIPGWRKEVYVTERYDQGERRLVVHERRKLFGGLLLSSQGEHIVTDQIEVATPIQRLSGKSLRIQEAKKVNVA